MDGMQEMMFCGTGSFKGVDKDACGAGAGAVKTPAAKAKKKKPGKKENPYASRGLDKFSTVVSELESRREKILRRVGPVDGDHVMVRFVQSEAKGWVPVVVKLPPEQQQQADAKGDAKKCKPAAPTSKPSTPPTEPASPREDIKPAAAAKARELAVAPAKKKAAGERWPWGKKIRPCHYLPFVAVLLLVSLVVFGRVFAICCTSIWWYLVPILSTSNGSEEGQGLRRPMEKVGKDLGSKKASDKEDR